jgi:hypothetical protein
MRAELRSAALGVFAGVAGEARARSLTENERNWLVTLAKLVARGRAGVEHDRHGDVLTKIEREAPTRLAMELAGLLGGMDVLGVSRPDALKAVASSAFGCIPDLRRKGLRLLFRLEKQLETKQVALALNQPTRSVQRTLQELSVHGLVTRSSKGKDTRTNGSLRSEREPRSSALLLPLRHAIRNLPGTPPRNPPGKLRNPYTRATTTATCFEITRIPLRKMADLKPRRTTSMPASALKAFRRRMHEPAL